MDQYNIKRQRLWWVLYWQVSRDEEKLRKRAKTQQQRKNERHCRNLSRKSPKCKTEKGPNVKIQHKPQKPKTTQQKPKQLILIILIIIIPIIQHIPIFLNEPRQTYLLASKPIKVTLIPRHRHHEHELVGFQ